MTEIKYEEVIENVDKHRCPSMFLCTVATTCYSEKERKFRCLTCWLRTMKEREVKVIYGDEQTEIVSSGNV